MILNLGEINLDRSSDGEPTDIRAIRHRDRAVDATGKLQQHHGKARREPRRHCPRPTRSGLNIGTVTERTDSCAELWLRHLELESDQATLVGPGWNRLATPMVSQLRSALTASGERHVQHAGALVRAVGVAILARCGGAASATAAQEGLDVAMDALRSSLTVRAERHSLPGPAWCEALALRSSLTANGER